MLRLILVAAGHPRDDVALGIFMTNNQILRRIRYAFDLNDQKMIQLFAHADVSVTRAEVSDWLKKDDDKAFMPLPDIALAAFLSGLS